MEELHPSLVRLLRAQGWDGLTDAQEVAHGPLSKGKHLLLVAPTGHGKTEAALLPVLSRILEERDRLAAAKKPWPLGFKALYITPLRALNRDLMGRLESWTHELGIPIGVRHGDTSQSERTKQSKNPPDLLITTPETLQLLLYGDTLRQHLATVRFLVVDEVHDLAQSERGAQLMVAMERIEEVIGQPAALRETPAAQRTCPREPNARPGGGFQRIGLSATVAKPDAVARWLAGKDHAGPRPIEVEIVKARKKIVLGVESPEQVPGDEEMAAELSLTPPVVAQVRTVRRIVGEHARVLIFHNTRDGAELLASRSALLDGDLAGGKPPLLGLHHGSLSAEHRTQTEEDFKAGRIKALVATSSLELGIDVGAIDHVVQVASPRSVARLVQRLGRSGHRVGGTSAGTLLATGPEDALECAAVARRAMEARLEGLEIRKESLAVLANQIVALANEYAALDREWTRAVVQRAGPFLELDDALFDATWGCLLDVKTLFPDEESFPKRGIPPREAPKISRSGRARKHFLEHISLIPDEVTYRVVDESTKRSIGTVDDAFVAASMAPGALIVMGGRSWRVLEVEVEATRVRVAPVKELGPIPQWTGAQLPVSFDVAQEVARLRRFIVTKDKELAAYPLPPDVLARAAKPLLDHVKQGLQVATDKLVTLEMDKRIIVANVSLGTRGNEALGRITQSLVSQKIGAPIGMDSDAYRIHFTLPIVQPAGVIVDVWRSLDEGSLDLLLALCLRDSPNLRYHLVQVSKQFGALPKDLDPNRMGKGRLEQLLEHPALEEETLSRLIHERMDVPAVAHFVRGLKSGELTIAIQGQGPMTHLGREEMRRMLAPPKTDEALLAAVRKRIEESDALLACVVCGNHWQSKVMLLPRKITCRRCQSIQVAVLRPWHEEDLRLLKLKNPKDEEAKTKDRMVRNAATVSSYGSIAARCLVARGVGPDTTARILQKITDYENPGFWREILQAELTFARTNMYWKR